MPLEGFLETVLRSVGNRFGASWGLLEPLLGFLGPLGASWGPLGASWGHLEAESLDFRFVFLLLGPSCGRVWALLGRPGRLLGRLWALLGRLGALLGASWAVLGRYWGPLGPSWSVGTIKKREIQKPSKRKSMILASWGPLGSALGALLGRLRGLQGRLGATVGVLERS